MSDFYCEEVLSGKTEVKKVFETDNILVVKYVKRGGLLSV